MEKDFKSRLLDEIKDIDIKMGKINSFLIEEVDDMYKADDTSILLLQIQYQAMATYREAVRARMEHLGMFKDEGK